MQKANELNEFRGPNVRSSGTRHRLSYGLRSQNWAYLDGGGITHFFHRRRPITVRLNPIVIIMITLTILHSQSVLPKCSLSVPTLFRRAPPRDVTLIKNILLF